MYLTLPFWGCDNPLIFLSSYFGSAETLTWLLGLGWEEEGDMVPLCWPLLKLRSDDVCSGMGRDWSNMEDWIYAVFLVLLKYSPTMTVKEQQQRHSLWGQEHGEGTGNTWRMSTTFLEASK